MSIYPSLKLPFIPTLYLVEPVCAEQLHWGTLYSHVSLSWTMGTRCFNLRRAMEKLRTTNSIALSKRSKISRIRMLMSVARSPTDKRTIMQMTTNSEKSFSSCFCDEVYRQSFNQQSPLVFNHQVRNETRIQSIIA